MRRMRTCCHRRGRSTGRRLADRDGQRVTRPAPSRRPAVIGTYKHLVVIYEENHSFDNLYGGWGRSTASGSTGCRRCRPAQRPGRRERPAAGCLPQNDVNLLARPAADDLHRTRAQGGTGGRFPNAPFPIDDYIRRPRRPARPRGVRAERRPERTGRARGLHPGSGAPLLPGAVPDRRRQAGPLRHRQRRRRPDMGHYETRQLPIYGYLHSPGAPNYVIADHFFQAAFGGSFLNHQ